MKIGELAEKTGISRDAIRFYERLGLLKSERSHEGRHGYRRYDASAVRRVGLINQGKALGFSLGEIQELLDAWADHALSADQKRAVITGKIDVIAGKILALQALSHELKQVLAGIDEACSAGRVAE